MFDGNDIKDVKDSSSQHIERPSNVRLAGPEDEDALYDLLLALDDDNGFDVPKSEERIKEAIRMGTRRQGALIGVVDGKRGEYGEGGELAASVAMNLQQFWYSDDWFLGEGWLFVRPEYRSNHLDSALFTFAKWCRQEMSKSGGKDMPLVLSMWARKRLPAKLRLWSRHARQVGGLFLVQ